MNENVNKKVMFIADCIKGEINRMCVTDDVDELINMCGCVHDNIDKLYRMVLDEKLKKED